MVKKSTRTPRSHKHGLMVSITPKRGLHVYFQKRASGYNQCVGSHLRNKKPGNREKAKDAFRSAVEACGGSRKSA